MVTVKVLSLLFVSALIGNTPDLAEGSELHAILGIDWTQMETRASSGQWLTNRFVPEVLSPLMVRIATVIEERYNVDFYQNIILAILLTWMGVTVVAVCLLASFRRYMARKLQKVPYLAEQLEARNVTAAATAMLSPC